MYSDGDIPRFISPNDPQYIDVDVLKRSLTHEELINAADLYFSQLKDVNPLITKPFSSTSGGASQILSAFSASLNALNLFNGAQVLDFGAGTGWTSRYLAQMGCNVHGLDISNSAILIAEEMKNKLPLYGVSVGELKFGTYDGFKINSKDSFFDRILCFDAFHHVLNQFEILKEFSRVLKPGGLIVLSEPGPNQSRTVAAQSEMRNFKVIEDNIVIEDIENLSKQVGFKDFQVAIYNPIPNFFSVAEFNYILKDNPSEIIKPTLQFMENIRLIRIKKDGTELLTSRSPESLRYHLSGAVDNFQISLQISNVGESVWPKSGIEVGAVNIVMHLSNENHTITDFDFKRFDLGDKEIFPGQTLELVLPIDLRDIPASHVEIDLVSEHITWFYLLGNKPLFIQIAE